MTNGMMDLPAKLTTEIPNLIHSFTLQIASDPDFADFVLNRFAPDRKPEKPVPGRVIFLAKILSLMWTQKDSDLTKIWFLDVSKLMFIEILVSKSHRDIKISMLRFNCSLFFEVLTCQ